MVNLKTCYLCLGRCVVALWSTTQGFLKFKYGIVLSGRSRISQMGRRQPQNLGQNLLFGKIFAENYMKMKEIGSANGPFNYN